MVGGEGAGSRLELGTHDSSGAVDARSGLSCGEFSLAFCAGQRLMSGWCRKFARMLAWTVTLAALGQ